MDRGELLQLLESVAAGDLSPARASDRLQASSLDLGYARLDRFRDLRCGLPEAIYGPGKTIGQVVEIAGRLREDGSAVLATRLDAGQLAALKEAFPDGEAHDRAGLFRDPRPGPGEGRVGVLCAGTADLPVAEEAAWSAEAAGAHVELVADVGVAGLHRLLEQRALLSGANVLIVAAGMEGALPSVVAGLTSRLVIALPTSQGYGTALGGLTPLLGMLSSCAPGVVAVNIDNGYGAGCAAALVNRAFGAAKAEHAAEGRG